MSLDEYSHRPSGTDRQRGVPLSTRVAVLFGGFMPQFGALFFSFGMIFWWVFGAQADVTSWYKFSGQLAHANGTVTACVETGMSEGGSDSRPGTPVYRIDYQYATPDQSKLVGTCYGTGMSFTPGAPVDVEYVSDEPVTSRIVGSRKGLTPIWATFVALFPLLGLVFLVIGLRQNARAVRVLKVGRVARGKLVSKEPTNTKINNQTVYKLTFEYEDEDGGAHQVSTRTHRTTALEDEETERLLYDPSNPSEGALIDTLPGKPKVDSYGAIQAVGPGPAILRMLLPIGGTAAHVVVGVILYLN